MAKYEIGLSNSPFKGKRGLRRIANALGYSVDGMAAAWRYEAAFRQVTLLAVTGVGFVVWLSPPLWSMSLIVLGHFICLIVELINSAIEAAVDHTSLKQHELAKRAKDLGSAAQLVSLVNLTFLWCIGLATSFTYHPCSATG
jgi:diacylglycerol kinase (ATP)